MSRIVLAFRCFFGVLFAGRLPRGSAEYLQESDLLALPATVEAAAPESATDASSSGDALEQTADTAPGQKGFAKSSSGAQEHRREGALALLGLLQREGRLVDFLQESIDDYDDSDIGAAVRDIHRGCKKVLADHVVMEPVMPGDEDDQVKVPKGFDPGEVRLVGEVDGEPPFTGVLRHHGWRVTETKLPTLSEGVDRAIVAPAEVELG